jgi:hypothetical protein
MLNGASSLVYKKEIQLPAEEPVELHLQCTVSVPKGKYTRMEMSDGTVLYG